ncbi:response regulator [Niveispirillum fermenti]|uniref:response regulator n=1 Tax=Niveispirillum fermenti TaxID=1233113 RepID=UPI003A8BED0C
MSATDNIVCHLPYLRRHARAVTGAQASGDAYVLAVLDILETDDSWLSATSSDRVGLFRLFSRYHAAVGGDWRVRTPDPALCPRRMREVLLLVALEGFTLAEVAEIMETPETEVRSLLAAAVRALMAFDAADVMIMESEPLIAMNIEQVVLALGHRVVGTARTVAAAVSMFDRRRPDLILADIQLADGGSGLEAMHQIQARCRVPVIFISTYPEEMLTGERPEPVFLVAKPFDVSMVRALIGQALFFAGGQLSHI